MKLRGIKVDGNNILWENVRRENWVEYFNNKYKSENYSGADTSSSIIMKSAPVWPKVTANKNIKDIESRKGRVMDDIDTIYSY